MDNKMWSIDEILQKNGGPLPLSRAGAYMLAARGEIPTVRLGRRVLVPGWWVEQLLTRPDAQQAR